MLKTTKQSHWITSLLTIVALIGFAGLCQAQSPINISFDTGVPSQFYDGGSPMNPGGYVNYYWQSTNGPDGPSSGCEVYTFDGTNDQEIDPAVNVSFNGAEYATITFQLKVDQSSGTIGNPLLSDYGNLQLSVRDASYSWNSEFYSTIYGPAANQWVTYTATVPAIQAAHIQIQLQGGAAYSGPVKVYIGNISVLPPPNPLVLNAFTSSGSVNWNNYGLAASWDSAQDAPYYNPVTGAGPTSITPAGSLEFQPSNGQYQSGQLNGGFSPPLYQWVGMDVYYDGPTTPTNDYGGFQFLVANGQSPYNWVYIGSANFTAGMIGHWTHFNFPCASSGIASAAGLAVQSTPGSGGGQNAYVFHVDNIQLWNPEVRPQILSFKPNTTPGGLQIAVDGDGTANPNDQEGICTPLATNSVSDFFWIGQTPATYSFTLTNFPSPSAAPSFDAHLYVFNGDSLDSYSSSFGYNQTYSGVNFNALDAIALDVINGTNGGVAVNFTWKTNTPNSNITNGIFCTLSNMTSANGAWALNFSDNTHASITLNGTVITNFTVPNFSSDPNYTANFTPATSAVNFGVYKDGQNVDDNQSVVFTDMQATNTSVAIRDNFNGPGLTASNAWVITEYYMDGANRTTWIPANTAFWLTWNSTQAGFAVQSSTNLLGTWGSAGVTYTYPDTTGTNTIAAVPASTLPPGGADFFDLLK
jgi:hypothetical protein